MISSPIEFYLEVNKGLGFTEVPEALHWDYGPDLPSKTLVLDVRDDKHITEITVKKHLGRIYGKADVKNRAEFLRKLMSME